MQPKILSAGVVVVRWFDGDRRYLILRAYRYWDFPKGVVGPGEDPLEAARREVREETALDDLEFRWGPGYRETPPYGRGKVARYYLAASPAAPVRLPVSGELGRPEHHEFRWADAEEAHGLLGPRVRAVLDWARERVTRNTPGPEGHCPGGGGTE